MFAVAQDYVEIIQLPNGPPHDQEHDQLAGIASIWHVQIPSKICADVQHPGKEHPSVWIAPTAGWIWTVEAHKEAFNEAYNEAYNGAHNEAAQIIMAFRAVHAANHVRMYVKIHRSMPGSELNAKIMHQRDKDDNQTNKDFGMFNAEESQNGQIQTRETKLEMDYNNNNVVDHDQGFHLTTSSGSFFPT